MRRAAAELASGQIAPSAQKFGMLYPLGDLAAIALIMTFGSVVQGALGFASGLLGVPLLVLFGFTIPEAATINLVCTSVQNYTGAWKLWSHLEPRELIYPAVVRLFTIPIGTYTVWLANEHLAPAQSKQVIGLLLLVTVLLLWGFRVPPRERLGVFWQSLAFASSGFLLGFASIGGAPLVLYVNALTWSAAKSRAFLFFCSAIAQPIAALFYWSEFRWQIVPAALSAVVILPLIFAGLWTGLYFGHHISKSFFRRVTYFLITCIALSAFLSPLLFR